MKDKKSHRFIVIGLVAYSLLLPELIVILLLSLKSAKGIVDATQLVNVLYNYSFVGIIVMLVTTIIGAIFTILGVKIKADELRK